MQHFRSSRWLLQSESNVRFQLLMQQESWKTCKHDKGSSPVLFFPVMYKVLKQEVVLMLDLLWADRTFTSAFSVSWRSQRSVCSRVLISRFHTTPVRQMKNIFLFLQSDRRELLPAERWPTELIPDTSLPSKLKNKCSFPQTNICTQRDVVKATVIVIYCN